MGLIRKVRGWMYRHSKQAQTDRVVAAMYRCAAAVTSAISLSVLADDPTHENEARVLLTRTTESLHGDAILQQKIINERSNG